MFIFICSLKGITQFPFVPGHEISGVVRAVGSKVNKFKVNFYRALRKE